MRKIAGSALIALLLAGCAPSMPQPEANVPENWSIAAAQAAQDIPADWWKAFGSEELDAMMTQALSENLDLHAGLQRVAQARAAAKIAGAPLLPAIDGSGRLSSQRTIPPHGSITNEDSWQAGLDVSYELDLFGGNRAAAREAASGLQASGLDYEALRLVIMSDTASAYFETLSLRERVGIARDNLKIAADIMNLVEKRFEAGASSALDVAQQKTAMANAQAALAVFERQQTAAENALTILLGRPPQTIEIKGASTEKLVAPDVAPILPAALMTRRPDIQAAEERLAAADANIDAARAAFFPSLDLGAGLTAAATPASSAATKLFDLVAALTMPIFEGGRIEGGFEQAQARRAEVTENYKKSVLEALKETEDALSAVRTARQRHAALKTAETEARKSYKLSRAMYDAGAIDFQTLLETQRTLLQADDNLAAAHLDSLNASVDLFKALGGGWQETTL